MTSIGFRIFMAHSLVTSFRNFPRPLVYLNGSRIRSKVDDLFVRRCGENQGENQLLWLYLFTFYGYKYFVEHVNYNSRRSEKSKV